MKNRNRWIGIVFLAMFSMMSTAEEEPKQNDPAKGAADEKPTEVKQVGEDAVDRIKALIGSPGIDENLAKQAMNAINTLVKNTRADQASIYTFVRTVNRNLDKAKCTNEQKVSLHQINRSLTEASYTDDLFQNGNLSTQIKVRLPLLIEDSVKLGTEDAPQLCKDFLQELELLSDRFLRSKRFRAGIGLSYAYLPKLKYLGSQRIDYSPFQTTIGGGSDLLMFENEFANIAYPSLLLTAKIPYVRIDANFSKLEEKHTTVTAVQFRDIDSSTTDILSRSTVSSALRVEYEASVKASATEIYELIRARRNKRPPREKRFDLGVGIGLTGFRIEDSVSTDVRFRSDDVSRFNDLPVGSIISSSHSSSFNTPFLVADLALKISDELHAGFEVRLYDKDRTSNKQVAVDGLTMAIHVAWFPTTGW